METIERPRLRSNEDSTQSLCSAEDVYSTAVQTTPLPYCPGIAVHESNVVGMPLSCRCLNMEPRRRGNCRRISEELMPQTE